MVRISLATGTILGSLAFLLTAGAVQADDALNAKDLLNLSLDQLSNIEVTSVSKYSEKASEAAAAIFVITQDDIKHSGATNIPDLLRMVPGISVAQSGSSGWAITSRGTSSQFANKLLVLIDGRSVYTPLFSGVYWDLEDVMLQDIDRIEVIRGPGATLWGANAVNGVINIITKSAKDTQGGLASQTVGNQDKSQTDARYGASDGNLFARVYAKYDDHEELPALSGEGGHDPWRKAQSGFRADGSTGSDISYTMQGDVYRADETLALSLPVDTGPLASFRINNMQIGQGANVLGRITDRTSSDATWTLQTYFDDAQHNNIVLSDMTNTFDIDLQETWTGWKRQEIVWGMGYRMVNDDAHGTFFDFFTPSVRNDSLFSSFVQDKIAIVPKDFFLTLGSKFEHNNYTGYEVQPSARLTWLIDDTQTWWSSASHAIRTPNHFSANGAILLAGEPGFYIGTSPNGQDESEELDAYEMGYRIQPLKTLSFDLSTYYNIYSRLVTNSVGTAPILVTIPGFGPTPVLPITPVNGNSGTTSGVELSSNWDATPWWKLAGSYSVLNFTLKNPEQTGFTVKGNSPKNQANLRSTITLPHDLELDNAIYYVDKLQGPNIPAYTRFDAKLSWKPLPNLELSLVGQNLLEPQHKEFSAFLYLPTEEVPRSYYGNITWKF